MRNRLTTLASAVLLGSALVTTGEAVAQNASVSYGRITAVEQVDLQNPDARVAGALVGGLAGLATGSGQSRSNRALRSLGGATVGGRVGAAAASAIGFQYTVLINNRTTTLVTEKAGLRVGDCVSVEQGAFANIRLAADERCDAPTATVPQGAVAAADACAAATQQLLQAATDAEFDRAERRMRLLCD